MVQAVFVECCTFYLPSYSCFFDIGSLRTVHITGDIAQLARAAALQAVGQGFESPYLQKDWRSRGSNGYLLSSVGNSTAQFKDKDLKLMLSVWFKYCIRKTVVSAARHAVLFDRDKGREENKAC
jgi:hypothetical protein